MKTRVQLSVALPPALVTVVRVQVHTRMLTTSLTVHTTRRARGSTTTALYTLLLSLCPVLPSTNSLHPTCVHTKGAVTNKHTRCSVQCCLVHNLFSPVCAFYWTQTFIVKVGGQCCDRKLWHNLFSKRPFRNPWLMCKVQIVVNFDHSLQSDLGFSPSAHGVLNWVCWIGVKL